MELTYIIVNCFESLLKWFACSERSVAYGLRSEFDTTKQCHSSRFEINDSIPASAACG